MAIGTWIFDVRDDIVVVVGVVNKNKTIVIKLLIFLFFSVFYCVPLFSYTVLL